MQIVIDIPDKYISIDASVKAWIDKAGNDCKVRVLPKGHGRLTDLDELINFTYNTYGINSGKCITKDNEDIIDYIYNKAETIIEADEESEVEDADSD